MREGGIDKLAELEKQDEDEKRISINGSVKREGAVATCVIGIEAK